MTKKPTPRKQKGMIVGPNIKTKKDESILPNKSTSTSGKQPLGKYNRESDKIPWYVKGRG